MKTIHALAVLFLTTFQLLAAGDEAATTKAKVGDVAPDFACRTLAGTDFSLSQQKGKVVLVNFFATWCGPCLAEMPHLEKEVYQKYKDRKDFQLIVVGREHDAPELKEFQKTKGSSLPLAPDPKREIYAKYATQFIPRNFVIGKDGKVKLASVGYTEKGFEEILQTIEKELAR